VTQQTVLAARSDALAWQAAARNRTGQPPPSADELDRERVQALPYPAARVAAALLSSTGWPPVPLDPDTLAPSAGPLTSHGEVYRHYRHRASDGCGLQLGAQPGGAVLVAVTGIGKAWADWVADAATERTQRRDEDGRVVHEMQTGRELGHYSAVGWAPPPPTVRTSGVAFGRQALDALAESMRPRRVGANEVGFVVWAAPPGPRPLTFPASRKLGHGLAVVGSGVVPWHAVRGDGWVLSASLVPRAEPLPGWLVEALGGRWGKPRAA